jgi:hypothetical protein
MASQEHQDAIALLEADHRTVEELFERFEADEGDSKQEIAEQICTELKIHTMIEEEIFYPALEGEIDDDLLSEAYVEHDGAKVLINDIMAGGSDGAFYDAKVKVLSEQIEHHVEEEEEPEDGMFAQARKAGVDLVALGQEMITRKQELLQLAETEGLPPAEPTIVGEVD